MSDRYNGDDYRSPRGRPDVNRTIYVGNLRYDTEEKIVRDWFEKYYGPVSFVKLIYDKETGRSKGFCFVTFEEEADATEALNDSNGRDLDGGIIRVNHARGPPSFPPGRRSFDGPPRGRGGFGRGDFRGGYRGGFRGGFHHGGPDRGGPYSDDRYSPRRSRSPRGGKHDRDQYDDPHYEEEGGRDAPKRRRRGSRSVSKSRSSGEHSPSYSSASKSEASSGGEGAKDKKERSAGAKPPPSGEAVKKEMMRLRKVEAELTGRVRALEAEAKAGKGSRAALEGQLEDVQSQIKLRDEQVKKYRQWLGALLECTTKLAAGKAAMAAAEAEVKQREADLALLNEEVAAFMSKAREERASSRRSRREERQSAAVPEDEDMPQKQLEYDDMVDTYEAAAEEHERSHREGGGHLAEAMQYAVDQGNGGSAGEAQEGQWGGQEGGEGAEAQGGDDVAAKFAPGIKFKLAV